MILQMPLQISIGACPPVSRSPNGSAIRRGKQYQIASGGKGNVMNSAGKNINDSIRNFYSKPRLPISTGPRHGDKARHRAGAESSFAAAISFAPSNPSSLRGNVYTRFCSAPPHFANTDRVSRQISLRVAHRRMSLISIFRRTSLDRPQHNEELARLALAPRSAEATLEEPRPSSPALYLRNACFPVIISYSTKPKENWSERKCAVEATRLLGQTYIPACREPFPDLFPNSGCESISVTASTFRREFPDQIQSFTSPSEVTEIKFTGFTSLYDSSFMRFCDSSKIFAPRYR